MDAQNWVYDLNNKPKGCYPSVEFKYSLENGYNITRIYNAEMYNMEKWIFKQYVECMYKWKIENTRYYTPEACEK